jgi:DNA polymerase III delta prime subunit
MNTACQNKILKTIEDADDNTTILFLCANDNTILQTIRSRCQIKQGIPLPADEIKREFPAFPLTYSDGTLILAKLYCENKDAKIIYDYAVQLVNSSALDSAIQYTPLLLKPENISLSFSALHYALKNANLPAAKKVALYKSLAEINRNISANCNSTNAFDLFLLKLFN